MLILHIHKLFSVAFKIEWIFPLLRIVQKYQNFVVNLKSLSQNF